MLRRYRLALALWLCSVAMVLVAFASAYIVRKGIPTYETGTGAYSTDWQPLHLPISWLLFNGLLLAGAALQMEAARRREQRPTAGGGGELALGSFWLIGSLVFGSGFIAVQLTVWHAMRMQGETMASGARPAFFYLLTGAHAVNVALGLLALAWIVLAQGRSKPINRKIAVDLAAWYFHAMTLLWVALLCFLLFA